MATVEANSESPSLKRRRRDSSPANETRDAKWRNALCKALDLDPIISDEKLEIAVDDFCTNLSCVGDETQTQEVEPYFNNLYRIICSRNDGDTGIVYEDPPIIQSTDGQNPHLSASKRVLNFNNYVTRNPGLSFAIIQEFFCCKPQFRPGTYEHNPEGITTQWGESLFIASIDLYGALLKLELVDQGCVGCMPKFAPYEESRNWEFWAFRHLDTVRTLPDVCDNPEKKHASLFSEYFCISKLPVFERIKELISGGTFTRRSLGYLFVPGDIVVIKSPRGETYDVCYTLEGWPSYEHSWVNNPDSSDKAVLAIANSSRFELSAWWFDGVFMKKPSVQKYTIVTTTAVKQISSLPMIPLECITPESQARLRSRGTMCWECRKMRYVSYNGWDFDRLEHFNNARFVIDPTMSKTLYRRNPNNATELLPELTDHLGPTAMNQADPPGEAFTMTTPISVWGFNMQDKSWKKLAIDCIRDVDWDEKAFDNLVIDPDSKDVIQALVTNKVQNSVSTDLVRGKGSGLILLLHGPPGTGKTLTAESVAEHARKPLYRVTCGDIGTKPEAVEQYLKRVLSLGKAWNCVVLLDEAEVFLQERSLEDLERNALVSVFLRHLEYYDGILILTSNRVGTFDEGFRSRIQLAIHYPKLEQAERRRVWEIFVTRLNDDPIASVDIDIRNLRSNLTELSKFNLNGREIRNSINVARPLAKSEGRKVDFESLKKVVKVQQKFDAYMKDMNEGLDDEKVAREVGKR
ncbi:hypothetical protein HD806DRAFT_505828 [Xylariaceae sp. AK1471]|nr:hypothetical protein HD806DRAFT_505828 [Xylariaceae sp. AK1471]